MRGSCGPWCSSGPRERYRIERRRQDEAALDAFLNYIEVLDFPDQASLHYARIRADLRRLGTAIGAKIGANDLFIAAHPQPGLGAGYEQHARVWAGLQVGDRKLDTLAGQAYRDFQAKKCCLSGAPAGTLNVTLVAPVRSVPRILTAAPTLPEVGCVSSTAAVFKVISASLITTNLPTGATTGTVEVKTPKGTLKSNVVFRVIK